MGGSKFYGVNIYGSQPFPNQSLCECLGSQVAHSGVHSPLRGGGGGRHIYFTFSSFFSPG